MDSPNPLFVLSIYEWLNLPTGTSTSKLLTRSNFFRAELAAEPPASGRLTSIYWHLSSFALTLHHSTTPTSETYPINFTHPNPLVSLLCCTKRENSNVCGLVPRSILSAQHPLPPVRLRMRPPKPDYARPTVLPECQPFHDAFPRRRPRGTVAFTPHLAGWKSLWRERGGKGLSPNLAKRMAASDDVAANDGLDVDVESESELSIASTKSRDASPNPPPATHQSGPKKKPAPPAGRC